jgi:hypothetical protein
MLMIWPSRHNRCINMCTHLQPLAEMGPPRLVVQDKAAEELRVVPRLLLLLEEEGAQLLLPEEEEEEAVVVEVIEVWGGLY